MGIPCYPDIKSLPKQPDLAVIMTAAQVVPEIIRECGEGGVHGVIIMSAGFKEAGEDGKKLEEKLKEELANLTTLTNELPQFLQNKMLAFREQVRGRPTPFRCRRLLPVPCLFECGLRSYHTPIRTPSLGSRH